MDDPRLADHAVGLELQLAELVEQHERAVVQHRDEDAARLQEQIESMQVELLETAEELTRNSPHAEVHGAREARSA